VSPSSHFAGFSSAAEEFFSEPMRLDIVDEHMKITPQDPDRNRESRWTKARLDANAIAFKIKESIVKNDDINVVLLIEKAM